jgi:transglutaminase-like putative cysteine protease
MMRFRLSHRSVYAYATRVDLAQHVLHLDVRATARQHVEHAEVHCHPDPDATSVRRDHFGNVATHVQLAFPHDGFAAELRATGLLRPPPPVDPLATPPWEDIAAALDGDGFPAPVDACEFAAPSPLVPRLDMLTALAKICLTPRLPVLAGALALCASIHRQFRYQPGATDVATPLARAVEMRAGVCQDFAHAGIGALRGLGLAARYVSGYLATRPAPGMAPLRGVDASHAWISVWCGDEAGWVDIDPTNDCLAGTRHVVAAWGRDYADVSPVRGVLIGGGAHRLQVAVDLDVTPAMATMPEVGAPTPS